MVTSNQSQGMNVAIYLNHFTQWFLSPVYCPVNDCLTIERMGLTLGIGDLKAEVYSLATDNCLPD